MKHHLVQYLEEHLKGETFLMTNQEEQSHCVYPCNGCGAVMYSFYEFVHPLTDEAQPTLTIELETIEAINIARKVWNYHSGLPPMSKRNFVDFLITLKEQSKTEAQ